jgi:hypothetical protein
MYCSGAAVVARWGRAEGIRSALIQKGSQKSPSPDVVPPTGSFLRTVDRPSPRVSGGRPRAGVAQQPHHSEQRRDDRGLRRRAADPRTALSAPPVDAYRLRRPAERQPNPLAHAEAALARLVPRHADEGRHAGDPSREPGHRLAPRRAGNGTPPHARLELAPV